MAPLCVRTASAHNACLIVQAILSLKAGIDDMAGEWEGEVQRANARAEAVGGQLNSAQDRMVEMAGLLQTAFLKADELRQGIVEQAEVGSFLGASELLYLGFAIDSLVCQSFWFPAQSVLLTDVNSHSQSICPPLGKCAIHFLGLHCKGEPSGEQGSEG